MNTKDLERITMEEYEEQLERTIETESEVLKKLYKAYQQYLNDKYSGNYHLRYYYDAENSTMIYTKEKKIFGFKK